MVLVIHEITSSTRKCIYKIVDVPCCFPSELLTCSSPGQWIQEFHEVHGMCFCFAVGTHHTACPTQERFNFFEEFSQSIQSYKYSLTDMTTLPSGMEWRNVGEFVLFHQAKFWAFERIPYNKLYLLKFLVVWCRSSRIIKNQSFQNEHHHMINIW